jgi:hypothetical protein
MTRFRIWTLATLATLLLAASSLAVENPTNAKATASGDNPVLVVPDAKRVRIHSITFLCTKEATAVVGLYVKAGSQNLIGDSAARFPIDKSGQAGAQGLTISEERYGVMATQTAGDDVVVNLDAAQPVIVLITFSWF